MAFTKITNQELNSRGATTLPNQPKISATALKQEFDAPAKNIVAPKFNNLIDELEATTAAASLGAVAPTGRTGETVQAVIDDISDDLATLEAGVGPAIAEAHTHPNKDLLDTYTQTEANLADAVAKKHSHENKTVLDKFGESSGQPTYNGSPIGGGGAADAYKTVKVGSTNIIASGADTLELEAGTNITLTPDASNKKVTIAASGGSGTGDMAKSDYDSDNAVYTAGGIDDYVAANAMTLNGSNAASHVTLSGAFTVGDRSSGTVGTKSTAEGSQNIASGSYSHAEGNATTASGAKSHAEGYNTTASGIESHAEGNGTTASGDSSHAEGSGSIASGNASHAGGRKTIAGHADQTTIGTYNDNKSGTLFEIGNGYYSLTTQTETRRNAFEVYENGDVNFTGTLKQNGTDYAADKFATGDTAETAIDDADYFPYYDSSATAKRKSLWSNIKSVLKTYFDNLYMDKTTYDSSTAVATAGGIPAYVAANAMAADGSNAASEVTFGGAFTAGNRLILSTVGTKSTALGIDLTASGNYSHAEGNYTVASGESSHAEGDGTHATGAMSHAEGSTTTASQDRAHAEGASTTASGYDSHAEGQGSTASGDRAHAEGGWTTASGEDAHAEGYYSTASGDYSHAGGNHNTAGYENQTVIGKYNSNQSTTLFEIGNGFNSANRSNAFEVYANGDVNVAGQILRNGAPEYLENNSVTLSTSGTTTVTFTNAAITANSMIGYACTQWGIFPDDITASAGTCTVTMPQVDTAVTVGVRIYLR